MKSMHLVKRPLFGLALLAGVLALGSMAQSLPTATADARVVSPEIGTDKKVTVRLLAPEAQQVMVTGDFTFGNAAAMTKDDKGVWSYTSGVLTPGIYGYFFSLDGTRAGIRMPDPGNLYVSSSSEHLKSYVEVPAEKDKPEIWSVRDVPHGDLHEKLYKSASLGTTRRIIVYTPPGYDPTKTYPTVYLFHGSGDNETMWVNVGRINYVMDNLIADGKVRPTLAVCCFGHTTVPIPPEQGPDGELYSVNEIDKNLVQEIIPLVDKEYHGSPKNTDRAIFGFSMGGYQSLTIGLNNPATFSYVAGFSSGFRANQDLVANFKGLTADIEASKKAFKLIRLGAGTGSSDQGNIAPSRRVEQYLTTLGVTHEFLTPEGGLHAWGSWRGYFADFISTSFGDKK